MGPELKKAHARIPARRTRTAIAIHNDLFSATCFKRALRV